MYLDWKRVTIPVRLIIAFTSHHEGSGSHDPSPGFCVGLVFPPPSAPAHANTPSYTHQLATSLLSLLSLTHIQPHTLCLPFPHSPFVFPPLPLGTPHAQLQSLSNQVTIHTPHSHSPVGRL